MLVKTVPKSVIFFPPVHQANNSMKLLNGAGLNATKKHDANMHYRGLCVKIFRSVMTHLKENSEILSACLFSLNSCHSQSGISLLRLSANPLPSGPLIREKQSKNCQCPAKTISFKYLNTLLNVRQILVKLSGVTELYMKTHCLLN